MLQSMGLQRVGHDLVTEQQEQEGIAKEKTLKDGKECMTNGGSSEDITIINIYAPNVGAPQYVRQMLTSMKGEINTNTIIVGDFNSFSPVIEI